MAVQYTAGRFHATDDMGAPLIGGKLYTYASGTTTPKATYTDSTLGTPNSNPIFLNTRGEAQVWLGTGAYTMVLKSSTGVTLMTTDGIVDPSYTAKVYTDSAILANTGTPYSPVIGGTDANSDLVLRSTSGAGTKLPATTTDKIIFQRGNNGNQELGRFTPGGSFGVGDFTDGTSVNVHAGDDGTTTRTATIRAKTAALFIGATDRTNSESGGPVGRSVVSFEGYRMANADGSRESGAVRVITEGSSTDKLGARIGLLTRRDGQTESEFVEKWWLTNDGHVYHGGGSGGVGAANRSGQAYGSTVMTISGQTGRSVIEQTTNAADADQTIIGDQYWMGNYQTDEKRIAVIQGVLAGSTATKRGGELRYYLKPDNGSLGEKVRYTAYWTGFAAPMGTLQAAPTLTITSNVITPTTPIAFLGAGLVKTITPPTNFFGGQITIIPTAAFTTDATGNIAIASTAVIGKALTFFYDSSTAKWYPSY